MNSIEIQKFKGILNKRIYELSTHDIDLCVDTDGDESDEVQGGFILDMAYEHSDRNNSQLNNLYEAVSKLESGFYGICEECEEKIAKKRLEVCPEAKYCIKCAELIEKNSRGYINKL